MARRTAKRTTIASAENKMLINKENIDLMDGFLMYKESIETRPSTIEGYCSDLNIIMCWCVVHNDNKVFVDWDKSDIIRFQMWCVKENGYSPSRTHRLKAVLSSLSEYIEDILDTKYPDFRPISRKIKNPKMVNVREKSIFTESDINILLDDLTNSGRYDMACALALGLYSGRRKSEITRFKVSDFDDSHLVCGGGLYKSDYIETKGSGSTGKQLECFCLAKKFKPYLDKWLEYREDNGIESIWLFPRSDNPKEHIDKATMDSWASSFNVRFKRLNIYTIFYWHSMRHLTVTIFKRFGIPDSVIQKYIGWSNVSMVEVYSDIPTDEQLSMYFNADGMIKREAGSFSSI